MIPKLYRNDSRAFNLKAAGDNGIEKGGKYMKIRPKVSDSQNIFYT